MNPAILKLLFQARPVSPDSYTSDGPDLYQHRLVILVDEKDIEEIKQKAVSAEMPEEDFEVILEIRRPGKSLTEESAYVTCLQDPSWTTRHVSTL
jgi:hypothetical protein